MRKKFLVVDDHPVFRQGLVALIETVSAYSVIAQAGDIEEALKSLETAVPDIALIDISLNKQNGLELVRTIKARHPDFPVLIVSMHDEAVYAERALKAGARGYIMKQENPSTLLSAIRMVLAGRIYLSDAMNEKILEAMYHAPVQAGEGSTALIDRLSERELEVLEYFGQGYGAKETAEILNLSVKTIHSYRDHLKLKLKLDSAAEVRRFAVKWYQSMMHRNPNP